MRARRRNTTWTHSVEYNTKHSSATSMQSCGIAACFHLWTICCALQDSNKEQRKHKRTALFRSLVYLSALHRCAFERRLVDILATVDTRSRLKQAGHRVVFSLVDESCIDAPRVRVIMHRHTRKTLPSVHPGQQVILRRFRTFEAAQTSSGVRAAADLPAQLA